MITEPGAAPTVAVTAGGRDSAAFVMVTTHQAAFRSSAAEPSARIASSDRSTSSRGGEASMMPAS